MDIKKQLFWTDVTVFSIFLMMLLLRFTTEAYMVNIAPKMTGEQISSAAEIFESNPFARIVMDLKNTGFIMEYILFPATIIALYIFLRNRTAKGRMDIDALQYYVNVIYLSLIINVMNDLSLFLAKVVF
jgi:hypothetical protein